MTLHFLGVWQNADGYITQLVYNKTIMKAFNSIFGKIGCSASEEVVFELEANAYQFLCMV